MAVIDIEIDAGAGTWEMTTAFLGLGTVATGTIGFARNPDTDGDGKPDTCDPDDDNDGIGDVYDRAPLDDSNANCTFNNGANATLVGATISAQHTTCASKESVDVSGTTNVGIDGDLRLISEKVSLTDTSVTGNGALEVINADPCPGCNAPPGYSDVQPIFFNKCTPCHTGNGDGGHNIGITYADALPPADNNDCEGLSVGQCTLCDPVRRYAERSGLLLATRRRTSGTQIALLSRSRISYRRGLTGGFRNRSVRELATPNMLCKEVSR